MKFVQRAMGEAAEASNPDSRAMRREIGFLLATTAGLMLVAYLCVGWIVELTLPRISAEREVAWFKGLSLAAHVAVPATPLEQTRFQSAQQSLQPLALQPGVIPIHYDLVLLADDTPNAFALPGGTIGVTRGMLQLLDDEISVAFVLGHELGHFAHRDHLRGVGRALGRALVMSLIIGNSVDALTTNATALLDLAHSGEREERADKFGLELVHRTYGRTEGTERLFIWLEKRERLPVWTRWLQTHPNPGDRIQKLRTAAVLLESGPSP
jgi:Zn-dependent protease with chaperone function